MKVLKITKAFTTISFSDGGSFKSKTPITHILFDHKGVRGEMSFYSTESAPSFKVFSIGEGKEEDLKEIFPRLNLVDHNRLCQKLYVKLKHESRTSFLLWHKMRLSQIVTLNSERNKT